MKEAAPYHGWVQPVEPESDQQPPHRKKQRVKSYSRLYSMRPLLVVSLWRKPNRPSFWELSQVLSLLYNLLLYKSTCATKVQQHFQNSFTAIISVESTTFQTSMAWKTLKISRMPSIWSMRSTMRSMRSTMGSTMGSMRSTVGSMRSTMGSWATVRTWTTTQGFQLLSTYTSSHFRRGFSTFKSFGLQVFHSFIFWVCYQIMQMIFLIFTFCRFLCNFWGRGRFGRRLKNFALHGEC